MKSTDKGVPIQSILVIVVMKYSSKNLIHFNSNVPSASYLNKTYILIKVLNVFSKQLIIIVVNDEYLLYYITCYYVR